MIVHSGFGDSKHVGDILQAGALHSRPHFGGQYCRAGTGVLAHAVWLRCDGVVERAPALRKTGGHAVDLFRPASEISEKMGVLPRIEALATGTTRMTVHREGVKRPLRVDLTKVYAAASDRHVEIMRDDLSEIYYDAGRDERRVSVGDSITATSPTAMSLSSAQRHASSTSSSAPTVCMRT